MRDLNSDVQANHGVLLAIESAKHHWETFIEELNGIFAIINDRYEILFCNRKLSQSLGLNTYNYLRSDFRRIIPESSLKLLAAQLSEVKNETRYHAKRGSDKVFEIDIKEGEVESPYLLMVSLFPVTSTEGSLFTVFGQDLTALKNSERRLAGVFSAIPLGVITLGKDGLIEDRYSDQSIKIIGQESIVGRNLLETLMRDAKDELFIAELKAIENLSNIVGKPESECHEVLKKLPLELHSVQETQDGRIAERWISVNYKPVLNNHKVERIVVVFEDKTLWVMMEREKAKLNLLEDDVVRRLFQVRSVSPEYAVTMDSEIGTLMDSARLAFLKTDKKALLRALHALKGNFRAVDFSDLSKMAHDTEEAAIDKENVEGLDWQELRKLFGMIEKEWSAVSRTIEFARAESGSAGNMSESVVGKESQDNWGQINKSLDRIRATIKYAARVFETELLIIKVKKLNMISLKSLEEPIKEQFQRVLRSTGKQAELVFQWDGIVVSRAVSSLIREALVHLVNNAVDHGFEDEAGRKEAGKSLIGTLRIVGAINQENRLYLRISDDGRGISSEKIKSKAISKGIITEDEARKLNAQQALALIFKPEFSTKDVVTEISGRGIGLDSVVSALGEVDGQVAVQSQVGLGSEFIIKLFAGYQFGVSLQCMTASQFVGMVDEMISLVKEKKFGEIIFEPQVMKFLDGIDPVILIDAEKLVVAIVLHCIFRGNKPTILGIQRENNDILISFKSKEEPTKQENENRESLCETLACDEFLRNLYFSDVIHQHHGEQSFHPDGSLTLVKVKNVFVENFELTIAFSRQISTPAATAFFQRVERLVQNLSGRLILIPQPTPSLDLWVSNDHSESKITTLRTYSSDSVLENNILNRLSFKFLER